MNDYLPSAVVRTFSPDGRPSSVIVCSDGEGIASTVERARAGDSIKIQAWSRYVYNKYYHGKISDFEGFDWMPESSR